MRNSSTPTWLTRVGTFGPFGAVALGLALVIAACSSSDKRSSFVPDGSDAGGEAGVPFNQTPPPCAGLACKKVVCDAHGASVGAVNPAGVADGTACPSGKGADCQSGVCNSDQTCAPRSTVTTTLTGKVYDPANANALYNVLVYIPGGPNGDAPLPAITQGVSCDTCASVALSPLVATLTNTKGEFELADVPVDKDVPIVIQVGKWRRQFKIDITKSCAENAVPDHDFRLPKNGTEGDMPHIAVTTGGCDALQCLLHGMGIDDSEFIPGDDGTGHIHVFNGYTDIDSEKFSGAPLAGGDATTPFGGELWNDVDKLSKYDVVLMSCECDEHLENKGGAVGRPGARQALWDYANAGGKIFASHYHYVWFKDSPQADFQNLASWSDGSGSDSSNTYQVDQTFPKGAALADWLVNVNASSSLGQIDLQDVRDSVNNVNPPSQSWIKQGDNAVRYFSVNTPTAADPADQCGRAVFGDLHLLSEAPTDPFPGGCPGSGGLNAQQKALEFMLFDLSGCVQSDSTPPTVPR